MYNVLKTNLLYSNYLKLKQMKNFYLILFILLTGSFLLNAQNISVTTQRYNTYRTGWNTAETVLNPGNVNDSQFGLVYTRAVDDRIYAHPLLISNLSINGKTQNVLFIETLNNSVYAFDADDPLASAPLWQVNVTSPGNRLFKNTDSPCSSTEAHIGIVCTPVVDTISKTMYFISSEFNTATNKAQQYFHAMDITTGSEKAGSPTLISAKVPGTGDASVNDTIYFDPSLQLQRTAMLLHDGVVYACWASFCDQGLYHGWVMGFDASTYKLKYTYNNTPNGYQGGIWMEGNAPSVDDEGYIYIISGNGTVGDGIDPNNPVGRGESLMKFIPTEDSLKLVNFFTPADYEKLEQNDLDYGMGTALLIPNTDLSVSSSKEGVIYILDNTKLGKYSPGNDSVIQYFSVIPGDVRQSVIMGMPVYYHYISQADSEFIYVWGSLDSLKQFSFDRSNMELDLSKTITGNTVLPDSRYGPIISGSSNGTLVGTGILWALRFTDNVNGNGLLEAYDARDIRKLLWSSKTMTANNLGLYPKFNYPVVANGKVYVCSQSKKIYVYGLKESVSSVTTNETFFSDFSVAPNPATSSVTIKYCVPIAASKITISFIDPMGRNALDISPDSKPGENSQLIQLNDRLKPGIYFVLLRSDKQILGIKKLVKY